MYNIDIQKAQNNAWHLVHTHCNYTNIMIISYVLVMAMKRDQVHEK